ncbi:MAG: hypothetical protein ACRDDZ_09370 [Marinifilaceae bacterium]
MKRINLLLVLIVCALTTVGQEKKFEIKGKPVVTIFGNYHAGFGSANGDSGFELERSYLGYEFSVTEKLGGKVVFDIGSSKVEGSDLERIAYVKNAMLTWKPGNWTMDFGLIGRQQFNVQEKFWGYRYISKSFQDNYKFGSSADMGVNVSYKFTKWLSADVNVTNGEGYKKLNKDNRYRWGGGVSVKPFNGFELRAYYDIHNGASGQENQENLALFAGYKCRYFSIGGEFNKLDNYKFKKDDNLYGYSVYGSLFLNKKWSVFGRFDELKSKDDFYKGDEQNAVAGIQFQPIKYLKISPNVQCVKPRGGDVQTVGYLSVEFKL